MSGGCIDSPCNVSNAASESVLKTTSEEHFAGLLSPCSASSLISKYSAAALGSTSHIIVCSDSWAAASSCSMRARSSAFWRRRSSWEDCRVENCSTVRNVPPLLPCCREAGDLVACEPALVLLVGWALSTEQLLDRDICRGVSGVICEM